MISIINSDETPSSKLESPKKTITVEPNISGFDAVNTDTPSNEGFVPEPETKPEIRVSDDSFASSEAKTDDDCTGEERLKFEQVVTTTSSNFDLDDLEFRVSDVEPVEPKIELKNPKVDVFIEEEEDLDDLKQPSFLDFDSACSRVDENAEGGASTTTTEAFGSEAAKALRFGFEPGDMVWGKVKSHPWWPGQIFNWAFASSSVRYTKREGHLLVAFFGDSSYGWFDPTDLIPFDVHYAEKSRQTNGRAFVKAVEEAVDEAKRRAALGLTCYCRDPINFRYTKVEGYFAVDVCGYEPGGLYSVKQIKCARDCFRAGEAVGFVRGLAMEPLDNEEKDLDCIKNVAMLLAYRKAVFEERDETYSQAFGTPLVMASRDLAGMLEHPAKSSPATSSATLVVAEGLGEMKSSTKPLKVKGQPKKDKYLLKRREYANELYAQHFNQDSAGLLASSGYNESASMSGDFVLQKRPPAPSMAPQATREQEEAQTISSIDDDMISSEAKYSKADARAHMNRLDVQAGCSSSFPATKGPEDGNMVGPNVVNAHSLPIDTNLSDRPPGIKSDGVTKKVNLKRPANPNADKTIMGEMKKKKKRKVGLDASADHSRKQIRAMKDGEALRKDAGKLVGAGLVSGGNLQVVPQKKYDGTSTAALSDSIASIKKAGLENFEIEVPQLLDDLLALALDPFHGTERYSPAIVRQVLLLFRSLVYQKSLVPPSEAETSELSVVGADKSSAGENRAKLPPKMPRPLARPDDPTKAGRKRSLSDRQEEMSAKRIKKVKDLRSLTSEKKSGGQKIVVQKQVEQDAAGMNVPLKPTKADVVKKQGEQREAGFTAPPSRPSKPDTVKKPEQLVRVAEPTMLVMMFPPRTTLPSVPELKAKFARFGPLDPTAFRVFWKSSSCRVVFKYKPHAQAAHSFAVRNKGFFGNIKVHYQLKDVSGGPAPEVPESEKGGSGNDPLGEVRRSQQPAVQLKSCLKKPLGEEPETTMVVSRKETTTGGTRKDPRVKFILDGEENSRKEQLITGSAKNQDYRSGEEYGRKEQLMMASYRNNQLNKNGTSEVGGGSSSPSLAMDVNSKNFRNNIPCSQPLPPLLPLPPPPHRNLDVHENLETSHHFPKASHSSYTEQKNHDNYTIISNKSIDISTQMLTLLLRCNDIVTEVTRALGYLPYHPL